MDAQASMGGKRKKKNSILRLGKHRNGSFRTLTEEFCVWCQDETPLDKRYDAGFDSYKCGRLFLHYNQASLFVSTHFEADVPRTKKVMFRYDTEA